MPDEVPLWRRKRLETMIKESLLTLRVCPREEWVTYDFSAD
jgi:hypothetical protein